MSWLRLESATRDGELNEGLEARIADPAWMLARQWQVGEFKGDDAANPLLIRMKSQSVRIDRVVLPGGFDIDVDDIDVPLETLVEREPVRNGPAGSMVAAELGWLLVRTLRRAGIPLSVVGSLRDAYPIIVGGGRNDLDPVGARRLDLLADASVDGAAIERDLEADPDALGPLFADLDPTLAIRVGRLIETWQSLVADVFREPAGRSAWNPERMEYEFDLVTGGSTGDDVTLRADGYRGGRLDWYAYDRVEERPSRPRPVNAEVRDVQVLPAPLRYRGMPAARFWEMEDGEVYFGHLQTAPEDLARVAVGTYGTILGDDWCVVPLRLPLGTLTQIVELEVLDDFGRVTSIPSTAVADGGGAGRAFKFFELTGDRSAAQHQTPLLFLPPTVEATDAGRPLEDVRLLRDESANLAWAIEQRIESAAGRPVDLSSRLASSPTPDAVTDDAWPLTLSTPVPANWVPLLPVRVLAADDDPGLTYGTVMLQRGQMPPSELTEHGAHGRILTPERRLLLHEEEVPREGIRVVRRFQSARDAQGRLHTWVGRRKGPGRGEGDSGLAFDVLQRS